MAAAQVSPLGQEDTVKGNDVGMCAARSVAEDLPLHHFGEASATRDHLDRHILV